MKTVLLSLTMLFFTVTLMAQTRISGSISDHKGTAIPGANVSIRDTYDGTSSDASGKFTFVTSEAGKHIVVFQALGYKSREQEIECTGQPLTFQISLAESINLLTAVTITAGAMEASDTKKAVVLKPLDIVTTSGAMGNITAALLTLPGTSTVGNDGRLFVRGGDASETSIFIDGLQVGNAYGSTAANVPTRNRFSPYLFKGSFFSTGGYSAEYGQALSSALALNTLDLPVRNQGDLSIMSLGGGYSQTLVNDKNALTATASYYNLGPYQSLVSQRFDWEKSPSSWDTEVSLRHKWGKTGFLKAYGHTEGSNMTIWQAVAGQSGRGDRQHINNRYSYGNVSFRQSGKHDWFFYGGAAFSYNRDAINLNYIAVRQINQLGHVKMVAVKEFSPQFSIKNGLEYYLKSYSEELDPSKRSIHDHQFNHFLETDYYFSNRLIFRGGLRSGYSTAAAQAWMDPRISLAYKLSNQGQISVAAGKFHQLPDEKLRVVENDLKNAEASHYILNYFIISNNRTFRAEAFYKTYRHLATYAGTDLAPANITQNGSGYARGADFFYRDKKSFKNTDFWITYSFVDSKRQYGVFERKIQPSFAPKHNGSVVIKHFVSVLRSQLGTSWSWNDGYTYTDPNAAGEMQRKTKAYSNLSISWSYLPRPNMILHVACSNVLGRNNVFGYKYAAQPDEAGSFSRIPVGQSATRMVFAGLFITFSRDKNANQLNNL
jgi:hypothetical protein